MKIDVTHEYLSERFANTKKIFEEREAQGIFIGTVPEYENCDPENGILYFSYEVKPKDVNVLGGMHGGNIFELADNAMGMSSSAINHAFGRYATQNFQVHFIKGIHGGDKLKVQVKFVKVSPRNTIAEVEISRDGEICVACMGTFALINGHL